MRRPPARAVNSSLPGAGGGGGRNWSRAARNQGRRPSEIARLGGAPVRVPAAGSGGDPAAPRRRAELRRRIGGPTGARRGVRPLARARTGGADASAPGRLRSAASSRDVRSRWRLPGTRSGARRPRRSWPPTRRPGGSAMARSASYWAPLTSAYSRRVVVAVVEGRAGGRPAGRRVPPRELAPHQLAGYDVPAEHRPGPAKDRVERHRVGGGGRCPGPRGNRRAERERGRDHARRTELPRAWPTARSGAAGGSSGWCGAGRRTRAASDRRSRRRRRRARSSRPRWRRRRVICASDFRINRISLMSATGTRTRLSDCRTTSESPSSRTSRMSQT